MSILQKIRNVLVVALIPLCATCVVFDVIRANYLSAVFYAAMGVFNALELRDILKKKKA